MSYKVVQWATGTMGRACLRAAIEHPLMDVVGLYVYDPAKVGQDAASLVHRPPIGVPATHRIEDILALDADVVIHAARLSPPYGAHDESIIRLLRSGKNVISINGYSNPAHFGPTRLARLQDACVAGGSTLAGAGLNPGLAVEQLAVVATGVCAAFDRLTLIESADCAQIRNPVYVFETLGFGTDPAAVDPNDPDWEPAACVNGLYAESLSVAAARLGLTLDRIDTEHRLYPPPPTCRSPPARLPAAAPRMCAGHGMASWRASRR